jgi:FtsP/CotA-like multicopper oxidase with cupredoxin domain
VDGLRAPLVLHPQTESHAYDDEFTVVLGDWYHHEHSTLMKHFISIANPRGAEPIPGEHLDLIFPLFSLFRLQTQVSSTSPRMGPTLVQNLERHLPLLPQQSDSMKMPPSHLYLGRLTGSASSTCLLYRRSISG